MYLPAFAAGTNVIALCWELDTLVVDSLAGIIPKQRQEAA